MITTHHHNSIDIRSNLTQILQISVWGFVIVASSFLFLYVGRWIDIQFNTEPSFMFGLFILAIFLCIWRLYGEARLNMERQRKERR
ncbi:MAG: AtpZ/AtpI family protein [Deltaproteobacteria bacterium]|nr:AtpZ/AtpI family protein [Deltaproteobacteria bacterium]